ncbi:Flp pilus assembly protein TadG [Paraburkholderia tropica]|uniref:pilus assembly protein TadG-related protein n=1 Tax=Paraburkholderia tropica TaxID=92647 RepID=UPI001CB112AA|nr:pilus assembly protein TadG-related protein [Paraburkholderia tropica]CAG9211843.1 Flp pilus assembly protein TadG [Paraburkholderia tropica]
MNKIFTGRRARRERGAVAVQVALLLITLLGCAAMALDIGRWVVVRHQLQNAADAAALAGVRTLPGQLAASAVPAVWATATTAATTAATQYASANNANGQAASAQTISVGYWDVANVPSSVPSSLPQTITSTTVKPAVIVTVSLAGGANLPLVLGALVGVPSLQASATSVAVVSAPGVALPGALFPIALNQCVYQNAAFWKNGQPITGAEIEIGNGAPSNCIGAAAQWTALTIDSNSSAYGPCAGMSPSNVQTAYCLMNSGNGPAIGTGTKISIQPGVESSIYNNFPLTPPLMVTVPVVADGTVMSGSGGGGDTPVVGFASLQIDYVIGANGKSTPACNSNSLCSPAPCTKCVIAHLIADRAGSTTAGGTTSSYYGALTPPVLAALPSSVWY